MSCLFLLMLGVVCVAVVVVSCRCGDVINVDIVADVFVVSCVVDVGVVVCGVDGVGVDVSVG